jgi:NADH-quinone oxidoreductase subunit A
MMATYAPLFLLFMVAAVLALGFLAASPLLGKKRLTREKAIPYECGSESTGARHVKVPAKFNLTAILFVIFDVEVVFVYPWAVEFRSLGWAGLFAMFGFLATLALALAYSWRKGALEWET